MSAPTARRAEVLITGGGTAGHVHPALAVAAELERRLGRGTVHFVGSRRGLEATLVTASGYPLTLLRGRGIERRLSWRAVTSALVLGLSTLRALALVARLRPGVVVTVGGYAGVPCALAAVVLRIPVVVVNVDAAPGAANRLVGRFARHCAVALPGSGLPRAVVTGVPVRDEVLAAERTDAYRALARQVLGIAEGRRVLAVTGGSLGARRLNEAAAGLCDALPAELPVTIYHVCGERNLAALQASPPAPRGALEYRLVAFEAHLPELFALAELAVCRAGALTVAELAAIGTPSVLVPLPNAPGDHQTKNAEVLAGAGAAVLVPDVEATPARIAAEVGSLLGDPARLAEMAAAAAALSVRDAAVRIAGLIEDVLARSQKTAAVAGRPEALHG